MNKFKKIYIIGFSLVLLIILSIGLLIIIHDKEFSFKDISERTRDENYIIQINYPIFKGQNKINKEIKKYVNSEKDNFFNTIKGNDINDNQLNIGYSYSLKDNIYSFHIRTYSITGDNNQYYRSDKIYYFNKDDNSSIALDDLIVNDKIYEIFKDKIKNYLNDLPDVIYNQEILNDLDSLVIFGKDYIQLIIKPNKLIYSDRELIININYIDVFKYLNKDYFTSIEENKEKMVKKDIPQIRDKRLFNGKKLVALTFDDGPSYDNTQKLIDELDKRNARVSFFMLGEHAIKQPELVKEIYIRGHTVGSHTYDHKQLTKLKMDEIMYEVNYTNEIIKDITGEDVKYLRPPYGSYNKEMLEEINMIFILWSVDVEDWKLKDEKKIANYIIENVSDGDVVLVHDIHRETINGVIKAIDELQNQGFAFVSIEELAYYKGIAMESHNAYRYFKS